MSELFHYTDSTGLKGILNEKCLWATHFRFLNDLTEGNILEKQFCSFFELEVHEFLLSSDFRDMLNNKKARYYENPSVAASKTAKGIYNGIMAAVEGTIAFFVVSLSNHNQPNVTRNGQLSQWRGYGDNGGYCIVFDESVVSNIRKDVERKSIGSVNDGLVTYVNDATQIDLGFLKWFARDSSKKVIEGMLEGVQAQIPVLDVVAIQKLLSALAFHKHIAFEEENEFRISLAAFLGSENPPFEDSHFHYEFREKEGALIPYIKLKFGNDNLIPIKRIIVGPGVDQNRRREGLQIYLKSKKIDAEVVLTDIPYKK